MRTTHVKHIVSLVLLSVMVPLTVLSTAEEKRLRYDAGKPKAGAPIDVEKLAPIAQGAPQTSEGRSGPLARAQDGAAVLSAMAANDAQLAADGFLIEGTEINLPAKISFPEREKGKRLHPAARYQWKLTWLSTNEIAYDKEVVEILPWKDWLLPGASVPQPADEPKGMTGRILSFINPEATGFFYFNGPRRPGVWSTPQVMARGGVSGDINLYRPNPVTLSTYLEMPLWRVGRGYAKYLERISAVEALENGRLAIKVEGKPSYSRATKWEMVVEPAAGYLVRSATYYVDDSDRTLVRPRYVITTSGLRRFGLLALPEKYEERDPFMDREQPFNKSGTVTAGSLKGDKQFLEATAAMFQPPFPVSTQVADNRSNPQVHLTFPAGEALDANALRQLRAVQTSLNAELVALTNTYELDPAMTAPEFAEELRKASAERDLPARPPKVKLILRLTNTGARELTFGVGARNSTVDLDLQGPKVVSVNPVLPMSQELQFGTNLTLKAGAHYDIPISSLISGTVATGRWSGTGKFSYWLEPGDYSLTATFTTGTGPKQVQVATEPVQLRVMKGNRNNQTQP